MQVSRIAKNIGKLSFGTLISRISGMLREMALAHFIGAGSAMDAFMVAFTLPNLFRRILGEKVMESALIPVYKSIHAKGEIPRANRIAVTVLLIALGLSAVITGAGMLISPQLVRWFAPGFDLHTHILAVHLTRIMFPFISIIAAASFLGAILLAHSLFAPYGTIPALFNISIILLIGLGSGFLGVTSAAVGVLVGGVLECVVFYIYLPRDFQLFIRGERITDPQVWKVGKLALPIVFETILEKAVVLVDRRLASELVSGSISSLSYAFRILALPFGVLGLAVSRVYYPLLVESATDIRQFVVRLSAALRLVLSLMFPCAAVMVVFREPIVRVLYRHGAFNDRAVSMTAVALACYSAGIIGMGVLGVLNRAFYSLHDTLTPVIVSVELTVLNIIFNYLLVRTPLKHAGLALASSIAFTCAAVILLMKMRKRLEESLGEPVSFALGKPILKIIPAVFFAGGVGWGIMMFHPGHKTWLISFIQLTVGGTASFAGYFAALKVLKYRFR